MENGDLWRNRRIFAHSSISSLLRQQLCLNCSVSLPRSSSPVWIAVTSTFGQEWGERRRLPIYVDPSQAWSRKGKHDRWKKAFTASELSDYGGIFISKRPQPFTNFAVIWKITESWMWAMKCTCFPCIMYFFPLVNAQLDDFVNGWINHGLSSAHNRTPRQLWIWRMQQSAASCTTVSEEMFGVSHYFTIDFQLKCSPLKSWILQ